MRLSSGTGSSRARNATQVGIRWQLVGMRCCSGCRHGHRQQCIGTESAFVGGSIELEQRDIECALVAGIKTDDRWFDDLHDVLDGAQDAFAQISALVAIA